MKMIIGSEFEYQMCILKAKLEVFDDIESERFKIPITVDGEDDYEIQIGSLELENLKKRHLSTFVKTKGI